MNQTELENGMLPFWSHGHIPTSPTLKKYGLSLEDWIKLFNKNNGCCHICGRPFVTRTNIDHEHVRGFKKMTPEQRRQYVRGLLCPTCNRFIVMRGMTSERLFSAWKYMRAWEVRVTPQALTAQSRELDAGEQRVQRRNVRHTDHKQNKKHNPG